jgi:hypothetical protein
MKEVGIVILISVTATAAAPTPRAFPSVPFVTAKSTQQFADCFASVQDRRSAPWWFVPNDKGGTFSSLGADSVRHAYFITIEDRGSRREIQIQGAAPASPQAEAVSQCI